ncbi:type II secretion system protein [Kiritimatiellaeota bacterium B1221]|nr:type II secretion system protein [Kiritimatiellaeota bacterium B1221]
MDNFSRIARMKRGFTLIEMLVVIAILALLISLVVPAVSKSLKRGQELGCLSNLRQLGQALVMYASDHKSQLPKYQDANGYWDEKVEKYLGDEAGVFVCPMDPYLSSDDSATRRPRTYACNGGQRYTSGQYPFGSFDGGPALYLEELKSRTQHIILLGERPGSSVSDRGYLGDGSYTTMDQIPGRVHRNERGGNYLYADLRVQYLSVEDATLSQEADIWYVPTP